MKIAWIGTGVMGSAMARNLAKHGHSLSVFNRTYEKATALRDVAQVYDNLADCVKDCEVVFTMVAFPKDVETTYEQLFQLVQPNTILIDMTTSSPKLAKQLYEEGKKRHLSVIDAPVSGGDIGAQKGTLSIMAGGDFSIFEQVRPLFACMGSSIHYMGEAGNGQHTKACNQIAVAGAIAALSEAMIYAKEHNLDWNAMLNAIKGGAAGSWQIDNNAPRIMENDFEPGFYIKHFVKDMHIVQENSTAQLQMLNTVCEMYEQLMSQGYENLGTQALIHYYKQQ